MLTRSHCCFSGISPEAELRLWRKGCLSWRHLTFEASRHFSPRKCESLLAQIPLFAAALDARCPDFFLNRLPCGRRLRILPEFSDAISYLDIETNGLERKSEITVIGICRTGVTETYVKGKNLHDFIKAWQQLQIVATFNGARFDLPMIMKQFGFSVHPPHIDLMDEARHWGLAGGLKAIEGKIGISRTEEESGCGEDAVKLWNDYVDNGNQHALDKLIAYNTRDVLSLPELARYIWKKSCREYPAPHSEFKSNWNDVL